MNIKFKRTLSLIAIPSTLAIQAAVAQAPVTLSSPSPAIAATYASGSSSTISYTVTNHTPINFPLTINGISAPLSVINSGDGNCGYRLASKSSCYIRLLIAPTSSDLGSTVQQTLSVNYQGRYPLKENIAFSVPAITHITDQN